MTNLSKHDIIRASKRSVLFPEGRGHRMDDALFAARKLLDTVTPLKTDCGRMCQASCCVSLEGEETGMLLFPGEERLYESQSGWRIRRTETGHLLLICSGSCDRSDRPLSCRIFPLLPVLSKGGIQVRMDLRARAVCPLSHMGIQALDPLFVEAVRQAGEMLFRSQIQREFLEWILGEQEEIRALRKRFVSR